mgnify:FL=1
MIKHWSINTTKLEKDPEAFSIWKLEQWVNWGIGASKAKKTDLIKYWNRLNLDQWKKKALHLAIFG